jgi:adenylate cyclase class 2
MSNKDLEIEIKIPLDQKTFKKLKGRLKKLAKFEKITKQVDEYFTPAHRNFMARKFPYEWLAIRRRGEKVILTYKHYYPENVDLTKYCDEYETEIKNAEQLDKLFSALNFKSLVTVEKERETYLYKNEFEIALDKVKALGYFMEIEAKKDFGSIKKTRDKIIEFAINLEIDVSKAEKRGYPYLLMTKRGLIK